MDVDLLIRQAAELAPLPASAVRIARVIADRSYDVDELADAIRLDEALTGRLLGLANSAASGPAFEITTVEAAAMRVGPGAVLGLAVGGGVASRMRAALPAYDLEEGALWRHSVTCALALERAGRYCQRPIAPEAFATGLLHDVGKLVLSRHLDEDAVARIRARVDEGASIDEAEQEVVSLGHAELGARVARAWGLPDVICLGIAHHHAPLTAPDERSRMLARQVQLGDAVATHLGSGCASPSRGFCSALAGSLGIHAGGFDALCLDVETRLSAVLDAYAA